MTFQEIAAIFIVLAPGVAATISGLGQRVLGDKGRAYVLAHHTYPVLARRFLQALQ